MNQNYGSSRERWVVKIQQDRGRGSRGSLTLMKYTTRLNLGVEIGYRVIQTSTTTFITSNAGTLVNQIMLIMFSMVLYINMNIEPSSYSGLFPRHASGVERGQGQSEFCCLSQLSYVCSRFSNRAYLSTSFMALKFKSAVLGIPGMHVTRWLASVLIAFLKRLADFMKNMIFCTIPTWPKFNFLHRNSKLVILTRHPNPALIIENMQKCCFRANPLNGHSKSFVKSTKSYLPTHS